MFRARDRDRSRFGGSSPLLAQATAFLGGVAPYSYWDFTTDRALFAGVDVGAISSTPGYSFTRATVGTAEDLAGNIIQFAAGEPRRTDRGLLLEGTRANLFLNSAVGVTQNVTVAAVAHTLSFRGTGTITLSGVSTAGPLVGTGASNRVALTFTPTAGTLTLTVSGSVTNVNLEAGAWASSWIPTAGVSVTRDTDILIFNSPGVNYPLGEFAQILAPVDTGGAENYIRVDNNAITDFGQIQVGSNDNVFINVSAGGVIQAAAEVPLNRPVGTAWKTAARVAANSVQGCSNTVLGTEDTVVTAPATPTVLRMGANSLGTNNSFAYHQRAAVFNFAPNDAQLQAMTT